MMGYVIDARLVQGNPQLRLIEPGTGNVRFEWDYQQVARQPSSDLIMGAEISDSGAARALKQLFKELMLVSCADRFSLPARSSSLGFGTECIDCKGCDGSPDNRLTDR